MKILYISDAEFEDYLCDGLLHGLLSLGNVSVVDFGRRWMLYQTDFSSGAHSLKSLRGGGFSLYGLLPENNADREDINTKIKAHYFDLIIYGNVFKTLEYISLVLENYKPQEVLFIDGEDHQWLYPGLIQRGLYFKRELNQTLKGVFPIHFAIPESKLSTGPVNKDKLFAQVDARNKETYIFGNETDYYADYQKSFFAITMQKVGWDGLRHYEILANQCIPNFLHLVECPMQTMTRFPKLEAYQAASLIEKKGAEYFLTREGQDVYTFLLGKLVRWTHQYLTTKALARYVLEVQDAVSSGHIYHLDLLTTPTFNC
ncbi:MAG: hypothetical protein IT292_12550 [Deltaproteobacteria bacterium]|nr:hypothetical protein [Deltaproteobacteria bacterium]